MKAVQLFEYGGPDKLEYRTDVPRPEPGHGEVLVRIKATSFNPIDKKIRSGSAKDRMPITFPWIPGRDLAGEIVLAGAQTDGFTQGQRVMALANHTYAEYAVASIGILAPIPDGMDDQHAAALPLIVTTGSQLVERAVKIKRGQTVLVTGALGSVGRVAVFVAKQHGARVIAGVRASQLSAAASLGAAQVVALDDPKALSELADLDAVADTVGGDVAASLLPLIKKGGVLGTVVSSPPAADKYDVQIVHIMSQPDAKRLGQLAKLNQQGEYEIPIAKVMPLSEVRQAHLLEDKHSLDGKLLLIP
jgi:NADPH:quinone reductase-like Zn-dependent oxidoreductase